ILAEERVRLGEQPAREEFFAQDADRLVAQILVDFRHEPWQDLASERSDYASPGGDRPEEQPDRNGKQHPRKNGNVPDIGNEAGNSRGNAHKQERIERASSVDALLLERDQRALEVPIERHAQLPQTLTGRRSSSATSNMGLFS